MCSATGSGHVITCTARRWVVSGRLYCFQRPPAEGRREACKPSTDPTSRITNVRINRTAAHRSIFRPAFVKSARRTESTPSPLCHRQDEKSCRRSGVYLFRCTAAPRLDKNPVNFSAQPAASRHRQDEKTCPFFQHDLRRAALLYTKYSGVPSSAGRKITPPRRTGSAP